MLISRVTRIDGAEPPQMSAPWDSAVVAADVSEGEMTVNFMYCLQLIPETPAEHNRYQRLFPPTSPL